MGWKESEKKAYEWFKTNIDPNAEGTGGLDSTKPDIYSPLYDSYIEVKDIANGARCGQFTKSTIKDNPFAQAIYDGDYSPLICKEFVQYHYSKKNVSHFIVVNGDEMTFHSWEEFFNTYLFEIQNPYPKRSGTGAAPKKDIPLLLDLDKEFVLEENGKVYCHNPSRWNTYISVEDPFDYFISIVNKGELRKRGKTKNMTWHLVIKKS